jgi:hypothetical protein
MLACRQTNWLIRTFALENLDVDLSVSLFAPGGVLHSPLYGPVPATQFYPTLFADTDEPRLTLRSVMRGIDRAGTPTVSFWFRFDWRLPSGVTAPLDVVDVARLDGAGRIWNWQLSTTPSTCARRSRQLRTTVLARRRFGQVDRVGTEGTPLTEA